MTPHTRKAGGQQGGDASLAQIPETRLPGGPPPRRGEKGDFRVGGPSAPVSPNFRLSSLCLSTVSLSLPKVPWSDRKYEVALGVSTSAETVCGAHGTQLRASLSSLRWG